ncbi:MAG: OmpA family protein [Bacteroidales bacterium]|nr:OmpA family protein [Bacteroidales bacterium]
MKRKVSIFLFLLLQSATICLFAQNGRDREDNRYIAYGRALHADDTAVVNGANGVGWIRSHFFDDWFLQMQGGGQLYYGVEDRLGNFFDRLTGNAEFHFGRRIFPMFGFRAGAGFGYAHGFLSKDTYSTHHIQGGSGQCGPGLQGYYWDYNNDLYIQKWKYFYFGVDLFVDLALFNGSSHYNPEKRWNHIVYGGADTKYALSETDTNNHRTEAHFGYICKYNFSPHWSVYADLRASIMERQFDREWVGGIESPGPGVDPIFNAQVGLIYKFHIRTNRDEFKRTTIEQNSENTRTSTVTHFLYVKMVDTNVVTLADTTIIAYEYDNTPTPESRDTIRKYQDDINKLQAALSGASRMAPLDSTTLGIMLPYEQVFFELDKWEILPSEVMKIEKMAQIMKSYPEMKFILIGAADSKTGTVKRNDFLSHQRADVVYNYLINNYAVNPDQLQREYQGGILDYTPFQLNRSTVIIMDHPYVRQIFDEMRQQGQAGGKNVKVE